MTQPDPSAPQPPACPSCGSTTWRIPSMVEVEVVFDATQDDYTAVTAVAIARTDCSDNHAWILPIPGEPDIRCGGCDEILLDWALRTDDDAVFAAHHDARRPTWDLLIGRVGDSALPEPRTWT